jgi:hypothetical protein
VEFYCQLIEELKNSAGFDPAVEKALAELEAFFVAGGAELLRALEQFRGRKWDCGVLGRELMSALNDKVYKGLRSKDIKTRWAAKRIRAVLIRYEWLWKSDGKVSKKHCRRLIDELMSKLNARALWQLYKDGADEKPDKGGTGALKTWIMYLIVIVRACFGLDDIFEAFAARVRKSVVGGATSGFGNVRELATLIVNLVKKICQLVWNKNKAHLKP